MYGATVTIYAETGIENLATFVPCFENEGSGLRIAAFNILPVEAIGVAEADGARLWEKKVGKSERANTGCPRRNVPDFGRVFLMLNYTDITQNT